MLPPSSLIIATRNRPRLLADTVASVLRGTSVPSELVIVDQSDSAEPIPESLAANRRCVVRHVPSRSIGLSRARNEGSRAAGHDLLAFLDDDMFVAPGWYEALVGAIDLAGPRAVVTGSVHAGRIEVPSGFIPATITRPETEVFERRLTTDPLAGGNMAIWRATLEHVGPFDERLGAGSRWRSGEDNDLGYRLTEAGYRIHYVPEARVYHRAWRPAGDYYRVRWAYGVGKGGFYTKHASLADLHTLRRASNDIGARLLGIPARAFRSRRRALGDLIYTTGVLWGAVQWVFAPATRSHTATPCTRTD